MLNDIEMQINIIDLLSNMTIMFILLQSLQLSNDDVSSLLTNKLRVHYLTDALNCLYDINFLFLIN